MGVMRAWRAGATLGISVLSLAWAARSLDGMSGLAAETWRRVSGLSGASFQALLRRSDQGFGDGRHTPLDNR